MTLATAHLIFRQIEDMLSKASFLQQSSVGKGNHSRREISTAPLLVIAADYWNAQVTGLLADNEWNEAFENTVNVIEALPLRLTVNLVPPDAQFIDLSKLPPDSDEYAEAYSKMDSDGLERYSRNRTQPVEGERDREGAESFVEFLKTLQIHPSSAYWKAVYSRVNLPFPESDPDRLDTRDKMAVWNGMRALQKRTEQAFNRLSNPPKQQSTVPAPKTGCAGLILASVALEELIRHVLF